MDLPRAERVAFDDGPRAPDDRQTPRTEKRCPRCRKTKALSEFNRDRSRPDGVQYCCRECWAARLEEKKSQLGPTGRRRWEHANYMRHRTRNVRRNWEYFNRRRLISPDLYVEDIDRAVVFARDNGMCRVCRQPIDPTLPPHHGDSFTIDHIKPLREGGAHSYANVRAAHLRCNVRERWRLARVGSEG